MPLIEHLIRISSSGDLLSWSSLWLCHHPLILQQVSETSLSPWNRGEAVWFCLRVLIGKNISFSWLQPLEHFCSSAGLSEIATRTPSSLLSPTRSPLSPSPFTMNSIAKCLFCCILHDIIFDYHPDIFVDQVTSLFSGLVVFSILGFMAHTSGLTVEVCLLVLFF